MTVYAVNIPKGVDISPALQFGEIKHINVRYVYGDEIENQRLPKEVEERMRIAAENFNPDRDYLLIAGDHLQLLAFVAFLVRENDELIRVLRWDKKAEGYLQVLI